MESGRGKKKKEKRIFKRRFGLTLRRKLTIAFVVAGALVSAMSSVVLFQTARHEMRENFRQRLKDIVATASLVVDAADHESLVGPGDEGSAAYIRVRRALQRVRDGIADVHFVYTMRKGDGGQIVFVVDAEEKAAQVAHLGVVYDDAGPMLKRHFGALSAPLAEENFYSDRWGTWLTGYAPIRDARNRRIGVIGIDIAASRVIAYETKLLYISLGLFLVCIGLSSVLGVVLGKRLSDPIVAVKEGAERLGEGDFDSRILETGDDEVGQLAKTFNVMAEKLGRSVSDLRRENEKRRKAERKYRSIFDNAMEGIFQSTAGGRLLTVNPALAEMAGYRDPEEMTSSINDLESQLYEDAKSRRELMELLGRQGEVRNYKTAFKKKDGGLVWAEINALLISDSNGGGIVEGLVKDVTGAVENERLEREREKEKAASAAKSDFLAHMSHEIRTPLNAIAGLVELMQRTKLNARQKDFLKKIKSSSSNLLSILNDILDYSKIEAGKLELENTEFALDDILNNLAAVVALKAESKGLEVLFRTSPDAPSRLIGDPLRLSQVLINLCGNAVKFTEKGHILVGVDVLDDGRESGFREIALEFSVRDTGIGIAKEKLDTLFDSFTQVDGSVTRKHGGTGLGLAISRKLVRLMGGDIGVESAPGAGAAFTFTLTFPVSESFRRQARRSPLQMEGMRVLVVDDNPLARDILAAYLESFSFRADKVKSGEEAVKIVEAFGEENPYELVLMDWKMPGMDGVEASRRIKDAVRSDAPPAILMVTAHSMDDVFEQARKAKIDAFLTKPVGQSLLFDSIMEVFGFDKAGGGSKERPDNPGPPAEIRGASILLVEDNRLNREVAGELLKEEGFVTAFAENGLEAVEILRCGERGVDIVLMDVQMPVMDGLRATAEIRGLRNENRNIPIIALTAHAMTSERQKCLDAGMNGHISKPIRLADLYAEMGRVVLKTGDRPEGCRKAPGVALENAALARVPVDETGGVDLSAGLKLLGCKEEFYKRLLSGFYEDYMDISSKIASDLETGDYESLERTAHTVRGVASSICAHSLQKAACELEKAANEKSGDVCRFAERFETQMDATLEAISRFCAFEGKKDGLGPGVGRNGTGEGEFGEILPKLRRLLTEWDVEAENYFRLFVESFGRDRLGSHVDILEKCIDNFDYEKALELLDDMTEVAARRIK